MGYMGLNLGPDNLATLRPPPWLCPLAPDSTCGNLVEILWDHCVDSCFRLTVCLKGFEDGRIRVGQTSVCRQEFTGLNTSPLRRSGDSVFDNSVERASRERTISGISLKRSHKIVHSAFSSARVAGFSSQSGFWVARNSGLGTRNSNPAYLLPVGRRTGFKREFDPGSESTLAACLTHASRTRKWSNP